MVVFGYYLVIRSLNTLVRAVARFFCNGGGGGGGHCRECQRHEPCRGVWGCSETLFSATCHAICLRNIDLEYENGIQLQVTIIKIPESKENKSIHSLDVFGSTGPGGAAALLVAPPPRVSVLAEAIYCFAHPFTIIQLTTFISYENLECLPFTQTTRVEILCINIKL